MGSAFRNFVILTLSLSLFTCAVWLILRLSAQTQPVAPPLKHPFLAAPGKSLVAYHPVGEGPTPLARLIDAAAISKDLVLWIDTRAKFDGKLVMAITQEEAEGDAPALDEVLQKFPEHRLILNFRGNREGMIQALAAAIETAHASDRVLVQSPEDGFLKTLREGKPTWLYGTSAPALTKFVMLSSIGLEALAPLKGDVIVVENNPKEHTVERLSTPLLDEAHRRSLKVYAGPAASDELALAMWNGKFDGVLVERPAKLWLLTHKP